MSNLPAAKYAKKKGTRFTFFPGTRRYLRTRKKKLAEAVAASLAREMPTREIVWAFSEKAVYTTLLPTFAAKKIGKFYYVVIVRRTAL